MKISVVTPVLNGERFIKDTVESVLNQKGPFELEYIIRDGGSTDRTLEILKEYEGRCILISEPDGSPQKAINKGMEMASGEISCWLNADDIYTPGTLAKVAETFQGHPKINWLYGRCDIIDEAGNEMRNLISIYKNIIGYFYSWNILLCENFINQPATFWRASLWRDLGGLDETLKAAFDYQLWLKMGNKGSALAIHQKFARFRRHSESISENHFIKQFQEEFEVIDPFGNIIHSIVHKINQWKILAVYKILSKLSK